ncbi:MAG: GIY-YIG nuclease family protein [Gemmatimonadetes bacterium]|nr:GIY-YIG nuclease family protein [Gemmatimonadota bacterium]
MFALHPAIKAHVSGHAEDRPGVYRWIGGDGQILYVGKSVRIKTRLLSYFREDRGKIVRMMAEARDVAWDYLPNEFSALVREMRLIQTWRPRYNVQHKRKRRHGFVKITRETAPRILPVTRVTGDGSTYYGPFGRVGWVAEAVADLVRALGLRDCRGDTPVQFGDQFEIFSKGPAPHCMRGETGSCLAPCAGRCLGQDYHGRVAEAKAFLEGRGDAPLRRLDQRMAEAAERLDFEYAARVKERRERLEKLQGYLAGFRGQVDNLRFLYRVPGFRGNDRLYLIHHGRIRGEFPAPRSTPERERIREEVRSAHARLKARPALDLDADAAAEVLLVAQWFNRRPKERERAVPIQAFLAPKPA